MNGWFSYWINGKTPEFNSLVVGDMYGGSKQANHSTKIQVSSTKSLLNISKAKFIHSLKLTGNVPQKEEGGTQKEISFAKHLQRLFTYIVSVRVLTSNGGVCVFFFNFSFFGFKKQLRLHWSKVGPCFLSFKGGGGFYFHFGGRGQDWTSDLSGKWFWFLA